MIINGFNIAAERVDLLVALTMLYLTVATRPRRTTGLSVVFYGQILSVANIILHLACIYQLDFSTSLEGFVFRITVFLYYVSYLGILMLLFSYIHLLSLKQRENIDNLNIIIIFFSAIYMLVVGCVFFSDAYIKLVGSNYIFTDAFYVNIIFAIATVGLVVISTVTNSDTIPSVLMRLIYLFVPFETIVLVIQLIQRQYVILSVTYVVPFMLCYVVFHGNIYDEVTGCQNRQAFEAHLAAIKSSKRDYTFVYIKFPRLKVIDNTKILDIAQKQISNQIRRLEQQNSEARVYQLNNYTLAVIFPKQRKGTGEDTVRFMRQSLDEAMSEWEYSNKPEYRMVVVRGDLEMEEDVTLDVFFSFLFERAKRRKLNFYEATSADYSICVEQKEIERVIVDIRNKDDLNDPRVIVFVQPIYDVTRGNYHNAEALMRLKVNDKNIAPDIFIPLAERVGCIHALTRIILNKVCKKIYDIQDYYIFDAVSVNVSLSEFTDYSLYDELIEIINFNCVPYNKIRLELTESMTSDEVDAINYNMEAFDAKGVHFYLDDFGTGYSNLERIVSLPFKTIKFDKSLLYKSMDDPILLRLIQNMVDVFKSHGLIVLVEGVENQKQADHSIKLGFEFIQGYNYAAPVPINSLTNFFESKRISS